MMLNKSVLYLFRIFIVKNLRGLVQLGSSVILEVYILGSLNSLPNRENYISIDNWKK